MKNEEFAAARKAIHINEAMQILDLARERRQTVNLKVWELKTGNVIEYRGWLVSSSNWKGGWHRVINPVNNQIRTVPDILIHEINGLSIYL